MCLATVYKNPENTVVCKNVSRIDVDGEYVLIRDILGEEIRLQGKIKMVDLANSIVELDLSLIHISEPTRLGMVS